MSFVRIAWFTAAWLCMAGIAVCGIRVLGTPQTWPEPVAIGILMLAAGTFAAAQARATQ
jgi:hypothetical protein